MNPVSFPLLHLREARAARRLVILTAAVFIVQLLLPIRAASWVTRWFALSLDGLLAGRLWQPVSYLFLHGGLWHLIVNLLGILMFGADLETTFGSRRFAILYLACGALGGMGWLFLSASRAAACVGASGAVFGVLGAFAAVYPQRQVTLLLFFVLPVTVTARTLAVGLGLLSVASLLLGDGNVAHAAHLAGGVAGYWYGRQWATGRPLFSWQTRRLGWRLRARRSAGSWRRIPEAPPPPDEVDRVLDKIAREGMGRLTARDRDILDRASRIARDAPRDDA